MHIGVNINQLIVNNINVLKELQKCGFYGAGKLRTNALASFLSINTFDY